MKGMRSPSGNGGAAKRVFVISPHPDDESRRVVFLTSGEKGGHGRSAEETIRIREATSGEPTWRSAWPSAASHELIYRRPWNSRYGHPCSASIALSTNRRTFR